jgi:hypothetical protein
VLETGAERDIGQRSGVRLVSVNVIGQAPMIDSTSLCRRNRKSEFGAKDAVPRRAGRGTPREQAQQ